MGKGDGAPLWKQICFHLRSVNSGENTELESSIRPDFAIGKSEFLGPWFPTKK